MENTQFFDQIRDLIARDALETALEQIRLLLENSQKLDEAILQSARFADIRKQIRLGLVSHTEANLTKNQIRAGLLDLLREIEDRIAETSARPDAPALRAEMEHAVSVVNSENTLIGSTITAGGNVYIGDKTVTQNAEKIYNIEKIDNANFS